MRYFQALHLVFKNLLFVLLALGMLSACSDDSDNDDQPVETISIGKSDGNGFEENSLLIDDTDLLSGQTTGVEVAFLDGSGMPYTSAVEVTFSTTCASSSITPLSIETTTGLATVNYTAGHCQGIDTIEATAEINGSVLTATGNVAITRPVNYSIGISDSELTPGQSTTLDISLLYSNGDSYTTPTDINLASNCVTSVFSSDLVTTDNGSASVTYSAGNCVGEDTITLSAIVNGTELVAVRNITILELVQISTSVDNASLVSGQSAAVTAMLSNSDGSPYITITTINFTTSCASSSIVSAVSTSGGVASTSYVAGNCTGSDTITATANINGVVIQSTVIVNISAPVLNLQLGSGSGATFQLGVLETGTGNLSAGQQVLSPGGSTTVTATIVDADNAYLLSSGFSGEVIFSSPCVTSGSATMTSPIGFVGGTAVTTYVDTGCSGDDVVTASTIIDTSVRTAQVTITSSPQNIGAIYFISSQPEIIAMSGIGALLPNTSTVTFRVVDNMGDPVRNQIVNFALDTNIGGTILSATSGVTGVDGYVNVVLQAGIISTPVRVTASTTSENGSVLFSTMSNPIVISSLYPEQSNFSLQFSTCNPSAWDTNGVTVEIMALAADHYNNPVPDGTPVSFYTEGGSIEGSCLTINGQCSVNWTSQNPRPVDGRITVLATMVGNESYIDLNSNGVLDDGDIWGPSLPEAWIDADENAVFDTGVEQYLDFDLNGSYTVANDLYDGVLCQHSTDCSSNNTIHVRQSGVINMASVNNVITVDGGGGMNAEFTVPLSTQAPQPVIINVQSITGQFPAAGTTIAVETTNGVISGPSSFEVPNNCNSYPGDSYPVTVYMNGDGTANTGIFTVTVTTDGYISQQTVNITDLAE